MTVMNALETTPSFVIPVSGKKALGATSTELLEAALKYAALNWPVIPLHSPQGDSCSCGKECNQQFGKHPRIKEWVQKASTDPNTIKQWWSQWPDANIGILTGVRSGLFVLDIDPRNDGDETISQLEEIYGPIPKYLQALTGGGGRHILFKYQEEGFKNSKGADTGMAGVDTKSEGGYIVTAPSLHRSGNRYEWAEVLNESAIDQLPLLPDWLLQLLNPAQVNDENSSVIPEGKRNDTLTRYAGKLRRDGAAEQKILTELKVKNQEECQPPLGDEELEQIAGSVCRYKPQDDLVMEGFSMSLGDFLCTDILPVEEIMYGLARGELGMMASITNAGKTTLILNTALALAAGETCLPLAPKAARPYRILYCDFEASPSKLREHLAAMLSNVSDKERAKENFNLLVDVRRGERPLNLSDPTHLEWLTEWAKSLSADLIIIDTVTAAISLTDENSNAEVSSKIIEPLKTLAKQTNAAVLFCHHCGKPGESGVREMAYASRGASAFGGGVRSKYVLIRAKTKGEDYVTLHCAKAKRDPFPPVLMKLDRAKAWFEICEEKPIVESSLTLDELIDFLTDKGEIPIKDIAKYFEGRCTSKTVRRRLNEGIELGSIESPQKGVYRLAMIPE